MTVVASAVSETVREAFNFSIDKFPLAGPDGLTTPWYGMFRSDTGDVVGKGSVSSRYLPHQTEDVCALVDAAAEVFDGEVNLQCHFRDGHYVIIEPTREQRVQIFGTKDDIFPRVMISAGFDKTSFRATMGYYRDLCRNCARMNMVSGTSVGIRHTNGLRSKMDSLIKTFGTVKKSWDAVCAAALKLESQNVNMEELVIQVFGKPDEASKRDVTMHSKRIGLIMQRVERERSIAGRGAMVNGEVTAWEAFNAIQGYVQHDAQSKRGFSSSFDRIIRASSDMDVIKAERILMSLAA